MQLQIPDVCALACFNRGLMQRMLCAGGRPPKKQRYKPQLTAASYRYFIRGQSEAAAADDFKVSKQKRIQLKQYDRLLKSFQYREALDAAVATGRPEIVSSLVEELAARSGLPAALGEPQSLHSSNNGSEAVQQVPGQQQQW